MPAPAILPRLWRQTGGKRRRTSLTEAAQIRWVESVPSTNACLREMIAAGDRPPHGYALAAHAQTSGVGRLGRALVSAPRRDLALSLLVRPRVAEPARLASLPLAAGLGVVDLLTALGLRARTRWPNDVLVGGRKICGILCEQTADPGGDAVIVGVGLNVNMPAEVAGAIDQPATSLMIESGRPHAVEPLAEALVAAIERRYKVWVVGGFAALSVDWLAVSEGLGRPVEVDTGHGLLAGVLVGFGVDGEMRVRTDAGESASFWSVERVRFKEPCLNTEH
jgi:BirA family biotin operon repressor/biotin-[acetyl-CoA-carboxylase] ligase